MRAGKLTMAGAPRGALIPKKKITHREKTKVRRVQKAISDLILPKHLRKTDEFYQGFACAVGTAAAIDGPLEGLRIMQECNVTKAQLVNANASNFDLRKLWPDDPDFQGDDE